MREEVIKSYFEKFQKVAITLEKDLQKQREVVTDNKKMTGQEFEKKVEQALLDVGIDSADIYHSSQKFPDFVVTDKNSGIKIGLEVKKTEEKKWEVIGGSIYESLRNDIQETYVIMAKMGGEKPEVRLRKYAECLADLKVTHSPRFYLNMDLEQGEDYLTTRDATNLLELEGEELNRKIRQLLRSNKSTWWSEEETTPYASLSQEEKNGYLNDGMALFPEVFGGNYEQFTPWLIYSCLVWCGNVRDIFSAGGNKEIEELDIYVSAIMSRCYKNESAIKTRIMEMSNAEILKFWGKEPVQIEDRIEVWTELVKEKISFSKEVIDHNRKKARYQDLDDEQITSDIVNRFFEKWKNNRDIV